MEWYITAISIWDWLFIRQLSEFLEIWINENQINNWLIFLESNDEFIGGWSKVEVIQNDFIDEKVVAPSIEIVQSNPHCFMHLAICETRSTQIYLSLHYFIQWGIILNRFIKAFLRYSLKWRFLAEVLITLRTSEDAEDKLCHNRWLRRQSTLNRH